MTDPRTPLPDEPGRILLVDDEAINIDVLRQTLAGPQYRLFVALNGEDALRVARRAAPLIILLDVVMPGIDGYETCRRLKADPDTRDAAVIFLSALTDPKDRVRGFEAGAVDFMTKPVQADEVIARVNTHLKIQRLLGRQLQGSPAAGADALPGEQTTGARGPGPVAAGTPVFRTGDIVAFRFRIVRYLARGGMGELYEAEDLELRERVALKTILSHIADDERSILLFKREVHLARQVTHPNVCRIYDVFRHGSSSTAGRPDGDVVLLAMELLHGETLAEKVQRDGPMSTAAMFPLVRQMADGLTAAHRAGVVHRDFKSHNVMLVRPQRAGDPLRAVVTDFGLAWRSASADGVPSSSHTAPRAGDSTHLSMGLSLAGEISGTPAYMAPEQVEGEAITPATDVYALGVVLYEMVTGTLPFAGDTPLQVALKRLHEPPPSPRVHGADVDPVWERTILRCLARRPGDRFANAADVVAALEAGPAEPAVVAGRRQPWTGVSRVALALMTLAIVVAGYVAYAYYGAAAGSITSVAVLPLTNGTNDPEQDYLSDGISEALINRLSQVPGLKVVANSSSSRYKGPGLDPQQVAGALGVAGIVAGRVTQRGDDLAISIELVDGRDRSQVWGERYVRKISDVFGVSADISRDIAARLRLDRRGTAGPPKDGAGSETRNPEAQALVLKGHFHRAKGGTTDRQKAAAYFTQAIAADPGYALAYADLSDIQRSLISAGLLDQQAYLPQARAAAQKALALDGDLADAHYALANLMTYAWEWHDAEREYRRAIELNPNLALAHRWYAVYLRIRGRHEQAITEIRRARELDPLSPGVAATVGYVLSSARRDTEAMDALKTALDLDRHYPYTHLFYGHAYAARGRHHEAATAYQQAVALGLDTPTTQSFLGAAYARGGDPNRARAILERLRASGERIPPTESAILLTALGRRDEAVASLEDAYRVRDIQLQYLGVEPGFDALRGDPRFHDLLRRVGLAE